MSGRQLRLSPLPVRSITSDRDPRVERAAPCWRSGACRPVEADSSGAQGVNGGKTSSKQFSARRGGRSPLGEEAGFLLAGARSAEASRSDRVEDHPQSGRNRASRVKPPFAGQASSRRHVSASILYRRRHHGHLAFDEREPDVERLTGVGDGCPPTLTSAEQFRRAAWRQRIALSSS